MMGKAPAPNGLLLYRFGSYLKTPLATRVAAVAQTDKKSLNSRMNLLAKARNNYFAVLFALLFAWVALAGTSVASTTGKKTAQKTASATTKSAKTTSSKHHSSSRKGKRSRRSASWRRGQQKIDSTRAKEIQSALIREHYLQGTATGTWDAASQRAMEKFQADNGWQTKVVPDSRALIKLGLGPNHDHLLNPESAMTGPIPSSAASARPDAPGSPAASPTETNGGGSEPQQ
jgi:hypothetical protein